MTTGMIFNIQKFCVHDGPGIRSIVFFKGCPLHCQWCSNPEGMQTQPEISYKASKCITVEKCGYCLKDCPAGAIHVAEGVAQIDRERCLRCLQCAEVCPAKAMEVMGQQMSVEEVLARIEEDSVFYSRSGGGMTLSGGEPLLQADFAVELLREAHKNGLETAIETTGCVPWEKAEPVFAELDFIHFDLKSMDDSKHKQYTGQSNKLIKENFTKLCQTFPATPIMVRTPVIPGFNDTVEDIQAIADFINKAAIGRGHIQYELLPFHNFGASKYEFQGKNYALSGLKNMDKQVTEAIKAQVHSDIPLL